MSELDNVVSPDDLLKVAQQQTGLTAIDSDSWRDGAAILLDEVTTSPVYTPRGRKRVITDAVAALERRLRIHNYIQSHPEVLDIPVEKPIFTLGMPRTGSTVISYLLDQDPSRRSLLHWECMEPVPPPTAATLRTDPRCLTLLDKQKQMLESIKQMNLPIPHWEDADGPTECMFIHNQDFKGLSWDAFMPTSRYAEWLINEADMTPTYEYQKRYLQVLQSKAPGRWSLKMPSHSVHIDALLTVFPDARFIWTHRDPYKASGSLGNLWSLPKALVLQPDSVDKTTWGTNISDQMKAHVDRPLRTRERIGGDRFFDMYYHEMMADTMGVMRRIYEWAGDDLTPAVEERMQQWLAAHPQDKLGVNTYRLGQYGLTVDQLQPVFAEYLDTFAIELEGSA